MNDQSLASSPYTQFWPVPTDNRPPLTVPQAKSEEAAEKSFWYRTCPLAEVTLRSSQLFCSVPPVRKPTVPDG